MVNKRLDKPTIDFYSLFSTDFFRLVESFDMLKAPNEIKVELDLKYKSMKKLPFVLPWDGKLYAYGTMTEGLKTLCKENGFSDIFKIRIMLEDWDSKFLMVIIQEGNDKEVSFFADIEAVLHLLKYGYRITYKRK